MRDADETINMLFNAVGRPMLTFNIELENINVNFTCTKGTLKIHEYG